jgi:hypothetical protein
VNFQGDTIICLSLDLDWACDEVINDTLSLLTERGLVATVFITHPGVTLPEGFEGGLHPNYRPSGDFAREYFIEAGVEPTAYRDLEYYGYILRRTKRMYPEAVGVRSHSMIFDSVLLSLYQDAGVQYDSTYILPLVEGLRPFHVGFSILEFPVYFNDHFELKNNFVGLDASKLNFDLPGLKILQFHPQMIYINATSDLDYQFCRPFYHDPDRLLQYRRKQYGIRDMFLNVLDTIALGNKVSTLNDINKMWRAKCHGSL